MSLSVNYLVFCVPTLHINNYRNRDIVLNTLITEFITLGVKHHMAGKVPKSNVVVQSHPSDFAHGRPPIFCRTGKLPRAPKKLGRLRVVVGLVSASGLAFA